MGRQTAEAPPDILETMWATHRESVRRLLLALARDFDLVDDLLQDTYVRARQGIGSYRGGDARAWLAAIARNVYHGHARHRWVQAELSLDPSGMEEEAAPAIDLVALLAIKRALASLPPTLRTALVMKHYAGYTCREIARHQRCPVGTAKWRVSEALDRLRRVLLERRPEMASAKAHGINIVDYVYGVLPEDEAAKVRAHLAQCESCRREAEELKQVVSALDALEGDRRMMHLLELAPDGRTSLYCTISLLNAEDRPLEKWQFQSSLPTLTDRIYQHGEEVPFTVGPAPEYGDTMVEYTFTLRQPVPPGGRLLLLTAGDYPPGPYGVEQVDTGRFRFHWVQGPSSTWDYTYVQAVRLPAGAQTLSVEPKPDETRADGPITLVWRRVVPAGQFFTCTIEYRLEKAN